MDKQQIRDLLEYQNLTKEIKNNLVVLGAEAIKLEIEQRAKMKEVVYNFENRLEESLENGINNMNTKKVAIVEEGGFMLSNEISIAYIQAKGYNDIRVSPSESRGCSDYIEFLKNGVWELFFQFSGEPFYGADLVTDFRTDPQLIQLIEEFQSRGINPCYDKEDKIKIIEIPDDVEFGIDEFEISGAEFIFECHRIWY